MMRSRLCAVTAVALLSACDDFNNDLSQYCVHNPFACAGDSGTGGGNGGNGGGAGGSGGGTGRCGDFGASCTAEGQCCATTMVSGTAYPLACSRINYCQIPASDCRAVQFTCSTNDQCCSGKCDMGRCADCAMNGPCTSGANCCNGYVCSTGGSCTASSVGTGPTGGLCKSSSECRLGFCDLDAGACADPATAMCTPDQSAPGPACCPGLVHGAMCCEPDGEWCQSDSDCCNANCYGGRCVETQPGLGQECDDTANCMGLSNWCDPVAVACVDRWCFKSVQTPYTGCCVIASTGNSCAFADGGVCILPGASSPSDAKCCSGLRSDGVTCDSVQIFD